MAEAEFFFECAGAPSAAWQVTRFHLREALSEPFELDLDLVEDGVSELRAVVGTAAAFAIARPPLVRVVRGVVRAAEVIGTFRSRRHVRLRVVPSLWLLSQRRDVRMFQDLSALDVVREVLRDAGVYQSEGALDDTALRPSNYAVREYCAQYNESDLDFVTRLLADEGITYFVRDGGDAERLVLVEDGPADAFPEEVPALGPLRVMGEGGATAEVETVRVFRRDVELQPTGVALREWDFTRPFDTQAASPGREASMTRDVPGPTNARQIYEYPARAVLHDYDEGATFYASDDLTRRAHVRHSEHTGDAQHCSGTSVVTGFAPGRRMHLRDEDGANLGAYTLAVVEHRGRVDEGGHDLHGDDLARYSNEFRGVLMPAVFRPRRATPRPIVHGPQTAVVLARRGSTDEIDIDAHGRVLVRFHWERPERRVASQREKNSSCRVRVAQPWAGAGWGVVFNPRVGMEVVVQFLDGDPDRPLVTGAVYNLHNPPPPQGEAVARRTRSTIRTNSSPGGHGFNELSFEDLAHAEEVFLRAQRDLRELVLRNHSTTVHGSQRVTVDGDQTVHVRGVQSVTVDGRDGEPGKHGTLSVTGDLTVSTTNEVMIKAPAKITLDCAGATATLTPGKIALSTGAGATILLENDEISFFAAKVNSYSTESSTYATTVVINGSGTATLSSAGATTVSGTPVQLNGPGPFAGRVLELAPATITTGAALVLVGGPSFPLAVTRNADGSLSVGDNLKIQPGSDPNFQNMVLRDLGIMASTPSGLERLNNIQNNPNGHDVTIREYNAADAARFGWNNSIATPTGTWQNSALQRDAAGNPVANAGSPTEIAYNPNIVLGPSGTPEPADATLFHEMGHAEHNAYGINRQSEALGGGWENHEEWQNIDGGVNRPGGANDIPGTPSSPAENDYLSDRDYPYRRTDHGSGYANPDGSPITP